MGEMNDYSGPFKPDFTLEDFSKEALIKLIHEYEYVYLHMSEAWYYSVKEEFGTEVADKHELAAWLRCNARVCPYYGKIFNFPLDTVENCVKIFHLCPDNVRKDGLYPAEFEVINENHVRYTVRTCRSLDFFEKEAPERIEQVCWVNEPKMVQTYLVNPNIKVTPLKLPPRKSPDEIACMWEVTM